MKLFRSADYKALGGKLVRVRLKEENGKVMFVQISGDFFLIPEDALSELERALEGAEMRETEIRNRVDHFFETSKVQSLGITPDDLVLAMLSAQEVVTV